MNYRLTVLTPTLVGDGRALAPIDYMVWKDHVNVLDHGKIFGMMAKRPVFETYLAQLRRAEKFDFQSWGGLAQSAALRRIPFESSAYSGIWEKTHAEHLFIPTFHAGPQGPFLPASAVRGALRTSLVHKLWTERGEKLLSAWDKQFQHERGFRYAAQAEESGALGARGQDRMRAIALGDSSTVSRDSFRVYLTRTSTLTKQGNALALGWKTVPRGSVDAKRVNDSVPLFCEMAVPGVVFAGAWQDRPFFAQPDIVKALGGRPVLTHTKLAEAANAWAADELRLQRAYAGHAQLSYLNQLLGELEKRLEAIRQSGRGCLLQIGWGGGFAAKAALGDTSTPAYREILKKMPFYASALATGLPFPKTRRVVFLQNIPAALPGWVHLEWV
ncbi:MAG: type III-A CRISPR-associated RAMP protein Csm5 [Bryobacter sp.]|nr:type III-A CRISPR-associated RAMP protein Csm5 [Bryobacter sp.]